MDSRTSDGVGSDKTPMTMDNQKGIINSKAEGTGSLNSKDMVFRADKIDLKNLDIQLEKHLSRVLTRNTDPQKPEEEWAIDLSKLDIRYVVAQGTYGIVYRGTYDNQDVAGNHRLIPFHTFFNLFPLVAYVLELKYFVILCHKSSI